MAKYKYNPYPLGQVPKELQRQEPYELLERGYLWRDPRDIIDMFEARVADFFGSKYAVATDCCSHAIFLSLEYLKHIGEIKLGDEITIPKRTYISVPWQILNAGMSLNFQEMKWKGFYRLYPTKVIDAAVIWQKGAYIPNTLMCLSFQVKKAIPIGRGGIILTDDPDAARFLKLASYDGRDLTTPYDSPEHVKMRGWHYYMTPEDAARGMLLMDSIGEKGAYMGDENYPDVTKMIYNASK